MKPYGDILATIEATRQDIADCEAVAARLAYGTERPDLAIVKQPTLLMFTAARQAVTAATLLIGASNPSSELYGRVEQELAGALARVSSLAALWTIMEDGGETH